MNVRDASLHTLIGGMLHDDPAQANDKDRLVERIESHIDQRIAPLRLMIEQLEAALAKSSRTERSAVFRANHDGLTGLPNRACLDAVLRRLLRRPGSPSADFALMFMDVDRFKQINDVFGHAAGDLLLSKIARRLRQGVPAPNFVARMSGDEFVIIHRDRACPQDTMAFADHVVCMMKRPLTIGKEQVSISVSVGIAVAPDDGHRPGPLMRNADLAMYKAKAGGGGRSSLFKQQMARCVLRP